MGHYRGMKMYCAPGVHEAAFTMLTGHCSQDARIIDLAAGTGAWCARLLDAGFRNLTAADIDPGRFQPKQIPVVRADFDDDFASRMPGIFEAATALEIIEHLENPRHFLRELSKLLADNGLLLLTTPNVSGVSNRMHFMRHGAHRWFHESDYRAQRHMSPLTETQLRLALVDAGFRICALGSAGTFWGWLKRAMLTPAMRLTAALVRYRLCGDVLLVVARKERQIRDEVS